MPLGSPTFRRFLRYARPYWLWITGSILAGLLKFSLALSLPICVGYIADFVITADVAPEVKSSRLWLAIAGLVAAFTLRMPAAYFRTYLAELAGNLPPNEVVGIVAAGKRHDVRRAEGAAAGGLRDDLFA